ncbi:MAG: hypothetical protein COS89_07770 [Deltaproteobacteria bacterium CG07_land_8_20_14_0_80_38_7]|nr:MAG: hypothetical protein COS89_07770 [Deltaproteobacteria bacterium CG07_land_8_20_14_0_80_38_7]
MLSTLSKWLDGYKTKIGGVSFICLGFALIGSAFTGPEIDYDRILKGATTIATGMAMLGLGGKAEKIIKTINGGKLPNVQLPQ